ncbi:hypothetical protein AAY473_034163 [Plecturocebus cupreus]
MHFSGTLTLTHSFHPFPIRKCAIWWQNKTPSGCFCFLNSTPKRDSMLNVLPAFKETKRTQQRLKLPMKLGFHHVGQDGLKLLASGDPHTSASQSDRITGELLNCNFISTTFPIGPLADLEHATEPQNDQRDRTDGKGSQSGADLDSCIHQSPVGNAKRWQDQILEPTATRRAQAPSTGAMTFNS